MKVTEFAFEAMLVRWAETSNGGATVVLQLADVDDLEVFKMMTLKSAKQAGQRLAVACSVIGDDEKPVAVEVSPKMASAGKPAPEEKPKTKPHFPAGKTGLAVMWCADKAFREWLAGEEGVPPGEEHDENWAKQVILDVCAIKSRKELDTSVEAAAAFDEYFRKPYQAHLAKGQA